MIAIQPQYLTLAKLLDGRLFRIPEYQRAYSWTTDQRRDLFEDILRVQSKGAQEGHFMAAIVALRRDRLQLGTDEFHVVEIVDGQQRLTTLIILLNAIKLKLDSTQRVERKLLDELSDLLVKLEGDELLLLQTNHDSSQHFARFLRKGSAEPSHSVRTIADRELLEAIEECNSFVSKWVEATGDLPALASLLKNRLFFLLHEIDSEKAVYTVFEVLNSRGLDVSWLDRLKSILMGSAFDLQNSNNAGLIKELHTVWRDIYSVIGLRQGMNTEALRFAATLKLRSQPSRPLSEQNAVAALRDQAQNASQIREIADWLLRVTRACDALMADVRLSAVTSISQARLLATAIHLRNDLTNQQRERLLRRWEKVSFKIYGMLRHDARTRVGEYVRLAWQIVNQEMSVGEIETAITEIGAEFSIAQAVSSLREGNCYDGWETELRYFLYRYEEHLAQKANHGFRNKKWEKIWVHKPSDSIEHIWPRSTAPDKLRQRLGNLVLLQPKLNSSLQDKVPKQKAPEYRKTGLLIAEEVADMIEAQGWTAKTIEKRESTLLKWAAVEWGD